MLSKGTILLAVSLVVAQAQAPNDGGQPQQPSADERHRQQQQEQMRRAAERQQERRRQQQVFDSFASGNVMMTSGGVPAEPIRIKYVCNGQASETLSDSKGRFTVIVQPQWYGNQEASLGVGNRSMSGASGCSIAAVAAGYRSNTITGGGTIILTPLGDIEGGGVISVTSLVAPKKAKALFFNALKELGKGSTANRDKVMRQLQKAIDVYPEYAAAWARLGQVKAESEDAQGAIVALEQSVQLDERYLLPYDALVRLYIGKGDLDHARELTKFVLGINPGDAAMRWYQVVCDYQLGRDDEAMALLGEIQEEPEAVEQFPKTHQIMGLIYVRRGQFSEAAAAYKRYLELDPNAPAAAGIEKQLIEWEASGVL